MKLHEEFKLYENMWGSQNNEAITESTVSNGYRVVLADYESDDFEINVEFGYQDPDESDVQNMEYLLKPGQTKGDLVVYLSEDCGYTSIYVHDERPATAADIKRLNTSTFPTTGRGDEWSYYGDIDESKTEESKEPLAEAAYTEKDFVWDEATIVADFKRAALAYMNGANLEDALHDIKVMIISSACVKLDPADTNGLFRRECAKYGIK